MGYSDPKDTSSRHVVVIGTGTLGRRVGLVWASKGGAVKMVDSKADAASEALSWIKTELPARVKAINGSEGEVMTETDPKEAVKGAWMVVECITEIKNAKIKLLGELDKCCTDDTIIVTTSSSYQSRDLIGNISEQGRARVLNTHYFQPPELSPVEVMSSGYTDPTIIDFLVPKLREIGLDPVVATKESLRSQLIGAWELVEYSAHSESDPSNKVYPMGQSAQGIVLYTPDGYMSAQLQIPGQPDFKVNKLDGGSQDELAQAGKNYLAYTGPFYVDESGNEPVLKHHMTNCSFPNWMGNTQRRMVSITKEGGNTFLTLGPEGAIMVMGEMRVITLKWRRLKDNQASVPPHTD